MKDNERAPYTPAPAWDPDGFEDIDFESRDWALAQILQVIDLDVANTMTLTVVVAGSLISGHAISRTRWKELLVEQVRSAIGDSEEIDAFADVIKAGIGAGVDHAAEMMKRRVGQRVALPPSHFLHIHKAEVLFGSDARSVELLRVLVDDISAWALGKNQPLSPTGP